MENDVLNLPLPGRRTTIVNPVSVVAQSPSSGAEASPTSFTTSTPIEPGAAPTRPLSMASLNGNGSMPPPAQILSKPHNRSKSVAVSNIRTRGTNRLSLSFPVQPPTAPSRYSIASPSTATSLTPTTPAHAQMTPEMPSPADSGNFLVALASQERRVFELKEELGKAEVELDRLKRQWGHHEAARKKQESRQVEPMQMLRTGALTDGMTRTDRQSLELDRRQQLAMVNGGPVRPPQRKVIAGQRHTRTLSLLEPGRTNLKPPGLTQAGPSNQPSKTPSSKRSLQHPRNGTSPSTNNARHSIPATTTGSQDAILRTGRQMAEDLKDGLWTFLEDLRQATVGDEALLEPPNSPKPPPPRRQSSKTSLRSLSNGRKSPLSRPASTDALSTRTTRPKPLSSIPPKNQEDISSEFWDAFEARPPETPVSRAKAKAGINPPSPALFAAEEDSWSAWGDSSPGASGPGSVVADKSTTTRATSPSPRWSSSTAVSEGGVSPPGGRKGGSGKQSPEERGKTTDGKREEIPWPQLQKLAPSHLKRTASNLMMEWERSLTPPVEGGEVEGA
ncbi:MAG: hypothetical protein M1814_005096 [Vezdaea aestivalis]|nr:MAG: hypothetical protein M1814_005096 [Vezdaea aestivalis]